MNKLPNFLIIGAAKCGTTSLYNYLGQHPEVFLSPLKETNFFVQKGKKIDFKGPKDNLYNHLTITDIGDYNNQFSDVFDEKAIGEICPSYLYREDAPKNIKEHIPKVKIIAILREPVARAFSAWVHLTRNGEEYLSFDDALLNEPRRIKANWREIWHYQEMSKYYEQLKRYYDSFPKENIKVFIYEEFKDNPLKTYSEICSFIDVDTSFIPETGIKHNTGKIPKNAYLHKVYFIIVFFKNILTFLISDNYLSTLKRCYNRLFFYEKPKLSDADILKYKRIFEKDIKMLEQLIDIDLSIYKA